MANSLNHGPLLWPLECFRGGSPWGCFPGTPQPLFVSCDSCYVVCRIWQQRDQMDLVLRMHDSFLLAFYGLGATVWCVDTGCLPWNEAGESEYGAQRRKGPAFGNRHLSQWLLSLHFWLLISCLCHVCMFISWVCSNFFFLRPRVL